MIQYRPESFDDCIAEAVRKFFVYYRNNVRQLLFTYPLDLKTKEGKLFWTLPKRPPSKYYVIQLKLAPSMTTTKTIKFSYRLMLYSWPRSMAFPTLKISASLKEERGSSNKPLRLRSKNSFQTNRLRRNYRNKSRNRHKKVKKSPSRKKSYLPNWRQN